MDRRLRPSWHIVISVFCLWHMFAVAAYLLPANEKYRPIRGRSVPYILSLSQWQKWDIFSPDPLRRTSDYRIDRQTFQGWETIREMNFSSLPWTVRAKELKVLGRLEEGWGILVPTYLSARCGDYPGTTVRLVAKNRTLPADLPALLHVSESDLPVTERVLGTATCPS